MYNIRLSEERGITETKKIKSYHSFTFNRYYNQNYLSWSDLRVLNEDYVEPQGGFPTHAHRNQLVLTLVLSGTLEHKDSIGNIHTIHAGDIQLMSAGKGVEHSEYNPSLDEMLHFLQIWIAPHQLEDIPSYQSYSKDLSEKKNVFVPLFSPEGEEGLTIEQDIIISHAVFDIEKSIKLPNEERYYWLQIIAGQASFNDHTLKAGDGLHYYDQSITLITKSDDFRALLFDMQVPK